MVNATLCAAVIALVCTLFVGGPAHGNLAGFLACWALFTFVIRFIAQAWLDD
jgi:hypothetical protein